VHLEMRVEHRDVNNDGRVSHEEFVQVRVCMCVRVCVSTRVCLSLSLFLSPFPLSLSFLRRFGAMCRCGETKLYMCTTTFQRILYFPVYVYCI